MLTPEPVSRRRRRAGSPYSVSVRADLDEAEPPIWRQVELPSTLHRDRRMPPALRTLRSQVIGTPAEQVLDALLRDADLAAGTTSVDETEAAEMTRAYSWLLRRVGDGLALTAAGWMPPAVVTAAMEELGLDRSWVGKSNREDTTGPVRALRASAQSMGLVRANKGRLLRTQVGVTVTDDPIALWSHIAQRVGAPPNDPFRHLASSLLLLAVAAGRPRDVRLHEVLSAAGWRTERGSEVSDFAAWRAAAGVTAVLHAVRAYGDSDLWSDRSAPATPGAQALARAALLAPRP